MRCGGSFVEVPGGMCIDLIVRFSGFLVMSGTLSRGMGVDFVAKMCDFEVTLERLSRGICGDFVVGFSGFGSCRGRFHEAFVSISWRKCVVLRSLWRGFHEAFVAISW